MGFELVTSLMNKRMKRAGRACAVALAGVVLTGCGGDRVEFPYDETETSAGDVKVAKDNNTEQDRFKPVGFVEDGIYQYDKQTFLINFRQEGLLAILPHVEFVISQKPSEKPARDSDRNTFENRLGAVSLYAGGVSQWSENCQSFLARITSTNLNQFEFGIVYLKLNDESSAVYITDAFWANCDSLKDRVDQIKMEFVSVNFRNKLGLLILSRQSQLLSFDIIIGVE